MATAVDVVVLGAGINGCGIARDAARRGFSVVLVDRSDIASGTTAASSRLIHGGLRYLEQFDMALVRESLRERDVLLRIAPHLVKPLQFAVPVYRHSRRSLARIRLGLRIYQLLSSRAALPHPQVLDRADALALEPGLQEQHLLGAGVYWDAQAPFPERLALENAQDAAAHGATIITYANTIRVGAQENGLRRVEIDCQQRTYNFQALFIVNATGPWVDTIAGITPHRRLVAGSRGTHLTVSNWRDGPVKAVYAEALDQRPFFVIPWNQMHLVGTTDIHVNDVETQRHPTAEEVSYLTRSTQQLFPSIWTSGAEIAYAYAGVRPLPDTSHRDAGKVTRRSTVVIHTGDLAGVLTLVGGKLTTYRQVAEQVVDAIAARLNHDARSDTAETPLPGARAPEGVDWRGVPTPAIDRLLSVYGGIAWEVVSKGTAHPALLNMLGNDNRTIAAEVVHAVEREGARSIEDIFLRRTMLGLEPDLGLRHLDSVAAVLDAHTRWKGEDIAAQRAAYLAMAHARQRACTTTGDVESLP
ncbi:MAG: FAD-dependent oxidoreductase [Chloroflexi bacterium]|nr:MAG: FAD-dependent oxidoreductase [Chloroflexota bacterium]